MKYGRPFVFQPRSMKKVYKKLTNLNRERANVQETLMNERIRILVSFTENDGIERNEMVGITNK